MQESLQSLGRVRCRHVRLVTFGEGLGPIRESVSRRRSLLLAGQIFRSLTCVVLRSLFFHTRCPSHPLPPTRVGTASYRIASHRPLRARLARACSPSPHISRLSCEGLRHIRAPVCRLRWWVQCGSRASLVDQRHHHQPTSSHLRPATTAVDAESCRAHPQRPRPRPPALRLTAPTAASRHWTGGPGRERQLGCWEASR